MSAMPHTKPWLALLAVLSLAACDDGGDSFADREPPEPPAPPPISIETPDGERCEILDSTNCLLPFPSSVFTVADESQVTGLRINIPTESTPTNKRGDHVDMTEWNRNAVREPHH